MRKRLAAVAAVAVLGLAVPLVNRPAEASPADQYSGTHFGADNLPEGCIKDMSLNNPDNDCFHMRTGMNGLDSPQVDVLVMVPVSPTAERDMRFMRQSVEMWEAGIDYLAGEMGMNWLADGLDFHITVDYVDPAGAGGEFTTYPIVDPEIVVIATNPVGGAGIGIDPVATVSPGTDTVPCTGVANPFDFEAWEAVPGFDSHHGERTGTYTEDCGGSGGNICFAINGAIDPAPEAADVFSLFDLVSHEFGHCLTIGHVGDGSEGSWGALPTNDIMAYHQDPPGLNKCVSTLDVEGIAVTMSHHLDVNGDGIVDGTDELLANDQDGDGSDAFQVQHPADHLYASGTGSPLDCPQPDLGTLPGERTQWTPVPVDTDGEEILTVTSPEDGATTESGSIAVTGTVEHVIEDDGPTETAGSVDDADDDATTPLTEILTFDASTNPDTVEATLSVAELWPSTQVASPTTYSVIISGRRFDSFVRYAVDANPMTWDDGGGAYMPDGTSTWDLEAKTVTFHIPRSYLDVASITAPYQLSAETRAGALTSTVVDDSAPDDGETIGLAGSRVIGTGDVALPLAGSTQTVEFVHDGPNGNTFYVEESSAGAPRELVGLDSGHVFSLDVAQTSDVVIDLAWTDAAGASDLDLFVTGAADSGSTGATSTAPEQVVLEGVKGFLNLRVDPYLVADPLSGATYTLTATVTPSGDGADTDGDGVLDADDRCPADPSPDETGCPDGDGDGVVDPDDVCPEAAGDGSDGCPVLPTEFVIVFVDGVEAARQAVDTANGMDTFDIPVTVPEGTHELRIDWDDEGDVQASRTLSITSASAVVDTDGDGVPDDADVCAGSDDLADADGDGIPDGCDGPTGVDADGDGVADTADNCPEADNPGQDDLDTDGRGDACDPDIDGDGHPNGKERAQGTDPADPASHPDAGRS